MSPCQCIANTNAYIAYNNVIVIVIQGTQFLSILMSSPGRFPALVVLPEFLVKRQEMKSIYRHVSAKLCVDTTVYSTEFTRWIADCISQSVGMVGAGEEEASMRSFVAVSL